MPTTTPLLTAVIPTSNRPELLARAIASVLAQSYREIEVVVVVDGPDRATAETLARFSDPRLRSLLLAEPVGGAEARNVGVRNANGEWIAFLDDDDQWMPDKIEKQLQAACARPATATQIVSCQVLARSARGDTVLPENAPRQPYSEYLLVRSRLTFGEGLMQTSTLMATRECLLRIPFTKGLRKHQDWDWILRCAEEKDFEVIFLPEPLAIWYLDETRARVSQQSLASVSLDWIRSSRQRVTRRAYASFLANTVAPQAAAEGGGAKLFSLFFEMIRFGNPRLRDFGVLLGAWLFPAAFRQKLRSFLRGREVERVVPPVEESLRP